MGITLREVIYDIGGGIQNDKKFKAVQIGGPSGGCLTEDQLDSKMDFDSLAKIGAMIGSGGLVIMDEDTCMVEVARFFMSFTQRESCGKCVPCREGTKRMLEILERIVAGNGKPSDMDELRELADMIESTALCGLGKSAPKPVISTRMHLKRNIWNISTRNAAGQVSVQICVNSRSIRRYARAARSVQETVRQVQLKAC